MINHVQSDHDDGYNAEEEEDDNVEVFKTSEEKLAKMTAKYNRLKCEHVKNLQELKDFKLRLNNMKHNPEDDNESYFEENKLVESKAKGFK